MKYNHKGFIFKVNTERLPSIKGFCVKMYKPRKFWFPLLVWEEVVAIGDLNRKEQTFDKIIAAYNNDRGNWL